MKEQVNTIRQNIKEEIHKKYGHEILYAKDCQVLSESILQYTNRQVSVSTLKRFFGIISTPFKPSKYTLDTLAIYLNFKNWQDFVNSFEYNKHIYSHLNSWEQLKSRILYISDYSMQSLGAKLGENITNIPVREFSIKKMDAFLRSPKIATAFIAPGGYGKSTLMYQLTNIYFTGKEAKNHNDIPLLIDGSILVNMISQHNELTWMHNLLEFDPKNSFSNYFRENPKEVKGRFVMIIDGLNEIFYQTDRLTQFVENLLDIVSSYENISWFKLIVTCRPDIWRIFTGIIHKKPDLKSDWFDVSFDGQANETINVPLLEKNEIKAILDKKHSPQLFQYLNFHYPQITELIKHPYFLNLFNLNQQSEDLHTDIDLLNQFVYQNVLTEPYSVEKAQIIDAIFHLSNYGKQISPIKKEDLPQTEEYKNAYKELICSNFLYEYSVPGIYLSVKTYVKFSHDILLEFMLVNKWLQKNKFDLELIRKVIHFYDDNRQLRCNLIKYLIKIAFKEGKTEILKDIYSIFTKGKNGSTEIDHTEIDPETINAISIELRKNKEMRDYLIPYYAKSKEGQLLYFKHFFDMDSLVLHAGENIKYYLENNPSEDAQVYGHYLKFLQYFLEEDPNKERKEFLWFKKNTDPNGMSPLNTGFYYSVPLIFQTVSNNFFDETLWANILQKAQLFYEEESQDITSLPIFEFLIVGALNYGDRFAEIIQIIQLALKRYLLTDSSYSWMYQLFMAIYARALLHTNKPEQALGIFEQVKFKNIPANYNYYVKLRYYLIEVEFLVYQKKTKQAKQLLQETRSIAQMIRFKYFYDKALLCEQELCGTVSDNWVVNQQNRQKI